jgi:response regulator of citrate/malate metabolism
MPPDIQPSIANETLEVYLNRTADVHNSHGYKDWRYWFDIEKISITEAARRLGVSRMTARKYKDIDRLERQNGKGGQ